ncbi:MAG TPA: delta-60 repeat domain-containing protein [Blastocatellia bacterium]|nr:delta-60 repeat domain-containing protein [Blastocatellia bacterium]
MLTATHHRPKHHHLTNTRTSRIAATACALAALLAGPLPVRAATGDLDTTFGDSGYVNTDFFNRDDGGRSVAIQSDGKIVVGGYVYKQSSDASVDFGLVRYDTNGALDAGFGSGGRVTTDFASNLDEIEAIAIQDDGKIVAAGFAVRPATGYDVALARYMPDGTLDGTFGSGGKAVFDLGSDDDFAEAVSILPGGSILVGGGTFTDDEGDFMVMRLTPAGMIDSSFGSDGMVTTDFFHIYDELADMAVTDDGHIVVVGFAGKNSVTDLFGVARYNSNGTPDTSFGNGGKFAEDAAGLRGDAGAVVVQPDGAVVVGGFSSGRGFDFTLARLTGEGDLDATFGTGGIVQTDFFGFEDKVSALALDGDKIVAAGRAFHSTSSASGDIAVARYNADGTLDTTFAATGMTSVDFYDREDEANEIAIDSDGNYVVAGTANRSTDEDFAVVRFEGDPVEPDFSVAFAAPTLTVAKGQKGQIEVRVDRIANFDGEVTVTAPDTKPIKVKLTPASASTTGASVTFNYKIKKKAALGSYQLTFTGMDGTGRTRSATLTLIVQ